MKFGLLGRKLGHSYSPEIHGYFGSCPYVLYEKEPDQLENFLKNSDFSGINVTIPYKKDVIPFLDELSEKAKKLQAVNTVVRRADGSLYGHNTDHFGFYYLLKKMTSSVADKKILVLGSGGASNTVVSVLQEKGADVVIISRSGENNYSNLHNHFDADAIVNTTPVGMYPDTAIAPVELKHFKNLQWVLDVIYNPAKTRLLLDAEKLGIPCENGLRMLVAQGKEAAEWFLNIKIPDESIEVVYQKLSMKMKNIILIGMPGSGKTTIASKLSKILNRESIDTDKMVTDIANKTIPDIFRDNGETEFRKIEAKAIETVGKKSGLIIATGGGCVTIPENIPLLRQNGTLFWIKRDLEKLPTSGRPLSQTNSLKEMYAARMPLYNAYSDYVIDNNGTLESSIAQILTILENDYENSGN